MERTGRRVSEQGSSALSPGVFPGEDQRLPGTAVTYRDWWAWVFSETWAAVVLVLSSAVRT